MSTRTTNTSFTYTEARAESRASNRPLLGVALKTLATMVAAFTARGGGRLPGAERWKTFHPISWTTSAMLRPLDR